MANLGVYNGVAAKPSGETLVRAPAAVIEVRREDTGALAAIFSNEAGTTPITNPSAFADANGNFRFYAAGLERGYRVTVTDGAFSLTLNNQAVGTKAQLDIDTPITTKGDIVVGNASGRQARKAVGTNGQVLVANSAQADGLEWGSADGAYRSTQVFTAGGTWTKPAGLKRVKVTVVGGGGGSGGCAATVAAQAAAAAGGGGGGTSIKTIAAAILGATETVTIGAGGLAAAAGANAGSAGGTSSFGVHCSATGGGAGNGSGPSGAVTASAGGGAGGSGASGDVNLTGSGGGASMIFGTAANAVSGHGGNSTHGGGGKSDAVSGTSAGQAGGNYGGGASGSALGASQAATAGSAGAPGIVIVEEFF